MATEQLTYAQIAERLGASVEAARAIVTRHHLPRSRSNDGKTLVSIDVKEIQHRRLSARSRGNHQADRLAATKDQLVAELQAVRALQEAAQVNERISTLEAELAAEQSDRPVTWPIMNRNVTVLTGWLPLRTRPNCRPSALYRKLPRLTNASRH